MKPGFVPYKLQFYIVSKKSYCAFDFLVLPSFHFSILILAGSLLKSSKTEKLLPFSFLQFLKISNLFLYLSQSAISCSNLTVETLKQSVKYVQS